MSKFLKYVELHPWKSVDEFIECQTMYVVYLYKESHPHYNTSHVKHLKENTRRILKQEHDEFEALGEHITKEVDDAEERHKQQVKNKLKVFYTIHGEETINVPLRAATDVSPRAPEVQQHICSVVEDPALVIFKSASLFE
jgi:hypothetical protein